MKIDEVMGLTGNNPVLCTDGMFGMLLVFPNESGSCGVQVPGEESHRWIDAADLTASAGGALRQRGSPMFSPLAALRDSAVQSMLYMDWKARGGADIPWTVTLQF